MPACFTIGMLLWRDLQDRRKLLHEVWCAACNTTGLYLTHLLYLFDTCCTCTSNGCARPPAHSHHHHLCVISNCAGRQIRSVMCESSVASVASVCDVDRCEYGEFM